MIKLHNLRDGLWAYNLVNSISLELIVGNGQIWGYLGFLLFSDYLLFNENLVSLYQHVVVHVHDLNRPVKLLLPIFEHLYIYLSINLVNGILDTCFFPLLSGCRWESDGNRQ